ncbi:MAG: D-tyrosyl-tRNA(Tyr) deacylase [Phycisphaera sp.]|nr:D-tyrosyl-tRNA(Tyr) deacylase [Phycisphaera sp.]
MRVVISRVHRAVCVVDDAITGAIERGLLCYVGVLDGDTDGDMAWVADKLCTLRLFTDDDGKINLSVTDIGGGLLLIPNFTLAGRTRKGTRPSFSDAAHPDVSRPMFEALVQRCGQRVTTASGVFGAHMDIESVADGPVTVVVESRT